MTYEEEIIVMTHQGTITRAEEEQLLTTMINVEIYQRRGL
jgi:hypothetical protein